MKIIEFEELASTNKYLLEQIEGGEDGEEICVRAQFQTDGRGQIGNGWESERGKNLTFSFVIYPNFLHPVEQYVLSQMVSVAIKHVLDSYAHEISIKWPNDIYWRDKKLAGILIENSLSGNQIDYSVIGIGLNVYQETFLSNAPNPISLATIAFKPVDIELLFNELLLSIQHNYEVLSRHGAPIIRSEYQQSLYRREGFHLYSDPDGQFLARIDRVSNDGCLHLITDDGEEREYYFKEVVFEH